jgi:hypothetical protein
MDPDPGGQLITVLRIRKTGSIFSFFLSREHEVEKRKQRLLEEQRLLKKIRKTPRELEQEKLVEGLQTSLDVSNKVKNCQSLM